MSKPQRHRVRLSSAQLGVRGQDGVQRVPRVAALRKLAISSESRGLPGEALTRQLHHLRQPRMRLQRLRHPLDRLGPGGRVARRRLP